VNEPRGVLDGSLLHLLSEPLIIFEYHDREGRISIRASALLFLVVGPPYGLLCIEAELGERMASTTELEGM